MLDQITDPDYYYHVALSRQIATSGFPEVVPQVKGIGWDILFTDKEYLFHVITSLFYSLFGEFGVRAAPFVFAAISSCVLAYHAIIRLGWKIFWLPLMIIAMDPHFARRMIMVRPQTLAVMFFILILVGFISNKKYVVLFSSMFFALSYHGLQIPGLLIGAALFTALVADSKYLKLALACGLGLVIGSLIHPYFPGNLAVLMQIINIVRDVSGQASVQYGGELLPWLSPFLLKYSILPFIAILLAFFCLGSLSQSQKEDSKEDYSLLMFLSVSFCIFLAVSLITPRGREYLIPTGALLLIQVFRHIPLQATVLVFLLSIVQFFAVKEDYGYFIALPDKVNNIQSMFMAFNKIPNEEKAHVLNCDWSQSPFLMYKKPNLSFVDILDPSFLMLSNPAQHQAREDMNKGLFPDYAFLMKTTFRAKYMLCKYSNVNLAFDKDPHFERLYPDIPVSKSNSEFALFKLKDTSNLDNYERFFKYSLPESRSQTQNLTAEIKTATASFETTYLNFLQLLPPESLRSTSADKKEKIVNCIFIQPQEITPHIGREFVGIGGGPNVRLWLNGEPLFNSIGEPDQLFSLDTLIPLPAPLKATDKLEAMVCPGIKQSYFGVTFSFWSKKEIQNLCLNHKDSESSSSDAPDWAYKGLVQKTCIGPIASKFDSEVL